MCFLPIQAIDDQIVFEFVSELLDVLVVGLARDETRVDKGSYEEEIVDHDPEDDTDD